MKDIEGEVEVEEEEERFQKYKWKEGETKGRKGSPGDKRERLKQGGIERC